MPRAPRAPKCCTRCASRRDAAQSLTWRVRGSTGWNVQRASCGQPGPDADDQPETDSCHTVAEVVSLQIKTGPRHPRRAERADQRRARRQHGQGANQREAMHRMTGRETLEGVVDLEPVEMIRETRT